MRGSAGVSGNREVKQFIRLLKKKGCRVEGSRRHVRVWPPEGEECIVISATPGPKSRWRKNARAALRRAGLDI